MKFYNNGKMYVYVYIQLTCYKYIKNMQAYEKESKSKKVLDSRTRIRMEGGKERGYQEHVCKEVDECSCFSIRIFCYFSSCIVTWCNTKYFWLLTQTGSWLLPHDGICTHTHRVLYGTTKNIIFFTQLAWVY